MFRFRKKKPTVKELTAETERLHAETEKLIRQDEDPNKLTANPITKESIERAEQNFDELLGFLQENEEEP